MMDIPLNLSEISAEMLLDYLYPDSEKQWVSRDKGAFYRNYNPDILGIDEENRLVKLSRDGFLRLLPQGMIVREDELKGDDVKERYDEIHRRVRLLEDAFLPFDTFYFRRSLVAERQVSELLNRKLEFILKKFFDFDLAGESNPYVKEAAVLLPYVNNWKGNLDFIRLLLADLLHCKVVLRKGSYATDDDAACWLPSAVYHLLIPRLSADSYQAKREEIEPLCRFLKEWFVPFDVHCEILIKEYGHSPRIGDRSVMNYNAVL
ncbi:hypothetical protein QUW47_01465 [Phocaeicola barnesiae]|uniref:hypothetical protein n=1 Tax=Phocaeicola barnesiae TaxID=376804 RepID=UPI0025A3F09D|nr:hypothetical protein [Phocaeicola barnesiae]MDM8240576.1 hypothetical protein [Phocaeicola barnesiae]